MRFTVQPLDGGEPVVLHDSRLAHRVGVWLARDGVDGWFGTPAVREGVASRSMTDGDMAPLTLTQGARTVTLHGVADASSTVECARVLDLVDGLAGRGLAIVGEDAHGPREMRGFMSDDPDPVLRPSERVAEFDLTVTCPDPHKYGPEVAYRAAGGLALVSNPGNCDSWPRIEVDGRVTALALSMGGQTVSWTGDQQGLEMDLATGEASGGTVGVDNAFAIPPGDHAVSVSCTPSGCTVAVLVRPCWR